MKYISTLLAIGFLATGLAFAADIDVSKLPPAADKQGVTFEKDIQPLLKASCVNCHSGQRPKGALRLDSLENVLKGGEDGKVVEAGNEKSLLLVAVSQLDPKLTMPPKPRPGRRGAANAAGGTNQPPGGAMAGGAGGPQRGPQGPPPKPLTPAEVGLVRAWIRQGAK